MEERLAIETISSPAAIDVATNEAVASVEITVDIMGTESVYIFLTLHQYINKKIKELKNVI